MEIFPSLIVVKQCRLIMNIFRLTRRNKQVHTTHSKKALTHFSVEHRYNDVK